jgi:hypothetical protein
LKGENSKIRMRAIYNSTLKTAFTLFLVALLIRLAVVIFWRFDGLYGQDPFAYFQQGIAIGEKLPQGHPPPLDFFWPNGFPLLIALSVAFLGPTVLAGQLISLLCGALLAPLAYLLARDLFPETGHRAGVLAALIVAFAGQPLLSSVVIMADMPALFWATLSAWLVVRATRQPRQAGWLLLGAGATVGLAIISRWVYGLVVPGLAAYILFTLRQKQITWWHPFLAVVSGSLILLPQLYLSLNRPEGILHSWLLGWRPANFFLRHFENIDGQFNYRLPVGVFYAQPAGHPAYIFPLLGVAALWGLWRLWRAKNRRALILLLGWLIPVYLFLAGIPYQNFRFGLTLYMPLVILSGFGVDDLWGRAEQTSPIYKRLVAGGVLISLVGMLLWAYPMLNNFLRAQNYQKAIARQVETLLPPEAILLTFDITLTFQHYTQLKVLEFFYCDETALDMLTRTQAPLYLFLNLPNIKTQWQGREPERNYLWLKENTTLAELGTIPPYQLFKVERDLATQETGHVPLCVPPTRATGQTRVTLD